MESPITTECEALRQEVELLAAENQRLVYELNELRKVPVYPEKAVRAVWEHGHTTPRPRYLIKANWEDHADAVGLIFVEALRDA